MKYALGTDIPIRWTLEDFTPAQTYTFEIYTGAGRKRVSDFTISDNVLTWTFLGDEQFLYGAYGLHLIAGSKEYTVDNAFELIHGTPSEPASVQNLSSSVEIDAEEPRQEEEEPQGPIEMVSPSPIHLEKIPLGSNIILDWKLLTAENFDFDLENCDLRLFYAASGSGYQETHDFELKTDNGYYLRWNFPGEEQTRFGIYSLFLQVYQNEALVAILEREYAFELVHRNGSDFLIDRLITFESVVTSLSGGALFALYDVLNNGYSTVFREDGVTPAGQGDTLAFNGVKWYAASGLFTRISDAEGNIAQLSLDAAALLLRMTNAEGDINDLEITAGSLASRISDAEGNVSTLQQTAEALLSRLENDEGDISELQQTASGILARVENNEGDIAILELTANALTSGLRDANGNISALQQTAAGLTSSIEDARGDISVIQQTAVGLQYQVENNRSDITTLQISASGLTTRVENAEGDISQLHVDVEGVHQEVIEGVAAAEGYTDALIADVQAQIDGAIDTWFYPYAPIDTDPESPTYGQLLTDVDPYATWLSEETQEHPEAVRDSHVGDIFYNTATSYAYRFQGTGNPGSRVYSWGIIEDSAVAEALAAAANAQDTADHKRRVFVGTSLPTPPYDVGDLWAQGAITSGANAGKGTLMRCATAKAVGELASASDWVVASDAVNLYVTKANFDVLADVIMGQVATYNSDGTIASSTFSTFKQTVGNIGLYITNTTSGLLATGINIEDRLIAITADNFILQNNHGSKAIVMTTDANGDPLISIDNMNVADIFTAPRVLSSKIEVGYYSNNVFHVMGGMSGIYDTTLTDPNTSIAAWYGGPMTDWKTLTPAERLTTPYAKSLFRMDGSGYLASGEIQWGASGDIILHGTSIEAAEIDENTTFTDGTTTFTVADLIELKSWFTKESWTDGNGTHYYLKLNASGTGLEGFVSGGFISAGGLSPGSGQASGNASYVSIDSNSGTLTNGTDSIVVVSKGYVDLAVAGAAGRVTSVVGQIGDVTAQQIASAISLSDYLLSSTAASTYETIENVLAKETVLADAIGNIETRFLGINEETTALSLLIGETYSSLDERIAVFEDMFEIDEYGVHVKNNRGFYGDSWISAGGVSSGGGASGIDLDAMWSSLVNNTDSHANDKINSAHLPDLSGIYQPKYVFTLTGTANTTYNLDTINSRADEGHTVYGYFSDGVLGFSHLPTMYIARTQVKSSPGNDTLLGITAISNASSTGTSDKSRMVWDSTHNAWHFQGNVYADGWISAGGVSSGGGSGGIDPAAMWSLLGAGTNEQINVSHLADAIASLNLGTVTSVGLSVPTGLSVSGSPITSSGTLAITFTSGYSIPTTTKQGEWDAKQDAIADLSDIRTNASEGHSAYVDLPNVELALSELESYFDASGNAKSALKLTTTSKTIWGVTYWTSGGVPDDVTGRPNLYIGTTQVQTSSATQDLTGIGSISAAGALTLTTTKKIYFGDTSHYLELDSNGFHFSHGVYSEGFMSAGGLSAGGGQSAGNASLSVLSSASTMESATISASGVGSVNIYSKEKIDAMVSAASGGVTGIAVNGTTYEPDANKIVTLPDYPNIVPLADAIGDLQSGMAGLARQEDIYAIEDQLGGIWGEVNYGQEQIETLQDYFTDGVANNAAKLDGHSSSYFATASSIETLQDYFDASGNAKKALQLATARNLWGQSFDGTADVSGDMTSVGNITPQSSKNLGSSSAYWANTYSSKLYLTADLYFEVVDGNVHLHTPSNKGFWADGFMSAGGLSPAGGQSVGNASLSALASAASTMSSATVSANGVGSINIYSKEYIDTALQTAGTIQSLSLAAGASNGTIHLVINGTAQSDVSVTGLGAAAYRGVASSIGSSVTGLVGGALLYDILGDSFDSTNTVKAFVNSSIATATATYKGSFNLVSDLSLTTSATQSQIAAALGTAISTADNNDYCYVQIPTSDSTPTQIARVDRYKHNGTSWSYEYTLNNSGYTAAQWSAINSGITSAKVGNYDAVYGYFNSGVLKTANGGTGLSSYTTGDILYASASNTLSKLAANSSGTKKWLSMTSSTPSWVTLDKGDVGLGNVENTAISTWAGTTNITTLGTITTGTWHGTAIANDYIASPWVKVGTTQIYLGGTSTTLAGLTSVTSQKFYLDADNYFEVVDGKVHLHVGTNGGFYTDGFVSAGGISSGSGDSGITESAMWTLLDNTDSTHKINAAHLRIGTGLAVDEQTGNIYATNTAQGTITSVTKGTATAGGAVSTDSSGAVTIQFPTDYSLPLAASGTRGGIQIGYSSNNKKYAVQLDNEKAYVNVPWSDTTYSAGDYLKLTSTTFAVDESKIVPITDEIGAIKTAIGGVARAEDILSLEGQIGGIWGELGYVYDNYLTTAAAANLYQTKYAFTITGQTGWEYALDTIAANAANGASAYSNLGNYVAKSGDTMTGSLTVNGGISTTTLSASSTGTFGGDVSISNGCSLWCKNSNNSIRIFADGGGDNYIESGNNAFTANADLHLTGYNGTLGGDLFLYFSWAEIYGSASIGGNITAWQNIICHGQVSAGVASDSRLKDNIETMTTEQALAIVSALRPVTFEWNDVATSHLDTLTGADFGLVAQEVESVIPKAVSPIWEKYKRVDYTRAVTPLIKVAQDHESRIASLERENKMLQAKVEYLMGRVCSGNS